MIFVSNEMNQPPVAGTSHPGDSPLANEPSKEAPRLCPTRGAVPAGGGES